MSEVDDLQWSKSKKQSQEYSYRQSVSTNDEKIQRLRNAKNRVQDIKDRLETMKGSVSFLKDGTGDLWEGDNHNWLREHTDTTLKDNYSRYVVGVDGILDNLCNEITRLENENSDYGYFLNNLVNDIRSIANEIEKFFN